MEKKGLSTLKISPKKRRKPYKKYSYALKRMVVYRIEKGEISIETARKEYGISSKSVIYNWIRKYSLLAYDPNKSYKMKQSPQEKIKELQNKIEELELEKDILLDIQEVFEEMGLDVKKYLPEQLLKELQRRKKSE